MNKNKNTKIDLSKIISAALLLFVAWIVFNSLSGWREKEVLRQIIVRLKADTRIAQVLVTNVATDPVSGKTATTIKFLEYNTQGKPLAPKYFTFSGNIIQFQSLVVRFQDFYVEHGDAARGCSAYLFLKVFFLDGPRTEVFDITPANQVPSGYKIDRKDMVTTKIEAMFWEKFWQYALNPKEAKRVGVKNVQIEAPGTKFVLGTLYTIKIEHNGGLRIDAEPLPEILKGERITFE